MTPEQEAQGLLLPELKDIRRVSAAVALAVAQEARDTGLGLPQDDTQLADRVARAQWEPRFTAFRPGQALRDAVADAIRATPYNPDIATRSIRRGAREALCRLATSPAAPATSRPNRGHAQRRNWA